MLEEINVAVVLEDLLAVDARKAAHHAVCQDESQSSGRDEGFAGAGAERGLRTQGVPRACHARDRQQGKGQPLRRGEGGGAQQDAVDDSRSHDLEVAEELK